MARLPLIHKQAAEAGERDAAVEYLRELEGRLRGAPIACECECAADILKRVADAGPKGWAAAGLAPPKRPRESARDFRIWRAVDELVSGGESVSRARARIAQRERMSVSFVKAICLAFNRTSREHADSVAD